MFNSIKIALLDVHNEAYEHIFLYTSKSKIDYCKLNNFNFINYNISLNDRTPHWARITGIKENLKNYDWILYLDTDTIITNNKFNIINSIDENFNIIVGRMPCLKTGLSTHLSSSAILIKNCQWSFDFLDLWYSQKHFISNPYYKKHSISTASNCNCCRDKYGNCGGLFYEQSALSFLYDKDGKYIKINNNSWCNNIPSNWTEESFLIHFPDKDKEIKIKKFIKSRIKF